MSPFKTLPREQVSNDLLWGLTRRNNAFLFTSMGEIFSHDPTNLTGLNLKKYSGLASDRAIGLNTHEVTKKLHSKKHGHRTVSVLRTVVSVKSASRPLPKERLVKLKGLPRSNNLVYSSWRSLSVRQAVKAVRGLRLFRRDLHTAVHQKLLRLRSVKRNHKVESRKLQAKAAAKAQ